MKKILENNYKGEGMEIKNYCLPVLPHIEFGWECSKAFIEKSGIVERDGLRMEYQVIRVYLQEKGRN